MIMIECKRCGSSDFGLLLDSKGNQFAFCKNCDRYVKEDLDAIPEDTQEGR